MESRRLSCSFMARAASSMSLNILGLTAAVWAITACVSGSTFNTALQCGQATSKAGKDCAIFRMIPQKAASARLQLDGEDVEQIEHLQAQQDKGEKNHNDGQYLAKIEAAAPRLKTPQNQAENVERGKPKY